MHIRSLMSLLAATLIPSSILSACVPSADEYVTRVERGSLVQDALHSIIQNGTDTGLKEISDAPWGTVTFFHEGVTPEEIEALLGVSLISRRYVSSPALIVLCGEGEVVGLYAYDYQDLVFEDSTYSSSARFSSEKNFYEPSGEPVKANCSIEE